MRVTELKTEYNDSLPQEFLNILPEQCPSCHSQLDINEALTSISCSNPHCIDKVVMRAKAMLDNLGVLGLGESGLTKYFEERNTRNPLVLLDLSYDEVLFEGASDSLTEKMVIQLESVKEMPLWEMVAIANIPNVQTSARRLLKGYSDMNKFYQDLEEGGLQFIQEKLGISESATTNAINIYNSLITYKEDLIEGQRYITLPVERDVKELEICISEGIKGFSSKPAFIKALNERFKDTYSIVMVSSMTKKVDLLVWEGGKVTSKVSAAERYGKPILSSAEFINSLDQQML